MRAGFPRLVLAALALLTACASRPATEAYIPRTATPPVETPTLAVAAIPTIGLGSAMVGRDGMILVYVPAGKFRMGSKKEDLSSQSDERPQRTVTISAFWIDQTEVTNRQYRTCLEAGVCAPRIPLETWDMYHNDADYDDHPAVYVDWENAKAYCEWVGRRLPTEAEWEKAARGPNARLYPWGDEPPASYLLNYNDNIGRPTAVRSYEDGVSLYGAYDMAGNVYEWVSDWYDPRYYNGATSTNPTGPETGERHIGRGGSYQSSAGVVRAANRVNMPIRMGGVADGGFRCVLPAP